jgi:phosphoribosylamine--glycine ligase
MAEPDPSVLLVVGSGGREHALVAALAPTEAVSRVFVAPGNGGTAREPKAVNVEVGASEIDRLVAFASDNRVGLTVVGPEEPLAHGIVDTFREAGLTIFGPTQAAARLETSKVWAREFMARHGVPHPSYAIAADVETAERAVYACEGECVVKADGLAAGKGVIVCDTIDEGLAAVRAMLVDHVFGEAGDRVLVEERLSGPEISVMAVTDGKSHVRFLPAQDYKRLETGDRGPNTGGMGAVAPSPLATRELLAEVRDRIIEPTIAGMAAEEVPFTGCLYCGLMLTEAGPVVLEYNARFGDPETQVQLPLLDSNLTRILQTAAAGRLAGAQVGWNMGRAAVCVVLASGGYPERPQTGFVIHGLEATERLPDVKVLHAGTKRSNGDVVTDGGRVLNVVATGDTLADAADKAYAVVGEAGLRFRNMQLRADIGRAAG